MPSFSNRSLERLETCDDRLQALFQRVVRIVDCSILVGHRGEDDQNTAFDLGRSKLRWPESKHNRWPSLAVDVAPYPIDWQDIRRFDHFAGVVRGVAESMSLDLRWGGDWDKDFRLDDQSFFDLVHYELAGPPALAEQRRA